MKLRRGFKAEAEAYALEFRQELDIEAHMPLCPWTLADHLAIPILSLDHLRDIVPEQVRYLKNEGRESFSAVTILDGIKRIIVHNNSHHPNRQSSNISHELAHGILGHPATPPLNEHGNRHYDREIENEADWLGATLLVPRPAALHIISNKMNKEQACSFYGVSSALLDWRINSTGVKTQLKRRKRSKRA